MDLMLAVFDPGLCQVYPTSDSSSAILPSYDQSGCRLILSQSSMDDQNGLKAASYSPCTRLKICGYSSGVTKTR